MQTEIRSKMKMMFSAEQIKRRVQELGRQISKDFDEPVGSDGQPLILLAILKGSFIFFADLAREINIPVEIEFAECSSYGNEKSSSDCVTLRLSPRVSLKGRRVLIVEDIAETGQTLAKVLGELRTLSVKEVRVCALLDKPQSRKVPLTADYVGFEIPSRYVVGYGLDVAQNVRNLPEIFSLDE